MFAPLLLLLAAPAHAIQCLTPLLAEERRLFGPMPTRPTEGGMFSFEEDDVVEYLDSADGAVRVHYSVSGPNVTILDDADADGLPDYAELVAETTAGVFDYYEELGLRRPLGEEAMGLGELGGSWAFDVYLVDFAGQGDGAFSADACDSDPNVCSGFFMIENDLSGYGYGSIEAGVDTLCSHELFHAVQAAYEAESPIWYTEGTAVLAEKLWRPDSEDFLAFADAYLDDPERSLDNPPTGPVPTFAYATCLWWDFLTTRLGTGAIVELQQALEWDSAEKDTLAEMERVIAAHGSDLATEWTTFSGWNLATKFRAGLVESYGYAAEIGPITITDIGPSFEDDKRFYPLAASYYQLQHPGGELWFANDDDATGVVFSLYPVEDGSEAGRVQAAQTTWTATEPARLLVAEDLAAGIWWVVGTHARIAADSAHFTMCLGDLAQAEVCVPAAGDTGSSDDTGEDDPGDCGCAGRVRPAGLAGLVLVGLALGWRRRAR